MQPVTYYLVFAAYVFVPGFLILLAVGVHRSWLWRARFRQKHK